MASSVNLGTPLEGVVSLLVKSGRYGSRSEVLRAGVRMVHERESKLVAFEAALAEGIADSEAGRVHDMDAAFDALEAEFGELARDAAE